MKSDDYHALLNRKKKELAGLSAQQTQGQRDSVEQVLYDTLPPGFIAKREQGLVRYVDHQEVMKHEPVRVSAGLCPSCDRPIDSFTGECGCS